MTLNRAIAIAADAHANAPLDHFGRNIIEHAVRVMGNVRSELKIAAVLHDVVEDSPLTIEDLKVFDISDADAYIVDKLTHRKGKETYFEYIARMINCPAAIEIKLADIADNMDIKRGIPTMPKMFLRYIKAMKILTGKGGST